MFFYGYYIVGKVCGYNPKDRKLNTEIVPLLSCNKDIDSHKSTYRFTGPEDEVERISCRAAKFSKSESLRSMMIGLTIGQNLDYDGAEDPAPGAGFRKKFPVMVRAKDRGQKVKEDWERESQR